MYIHFLKSHERVISLGRYSGCYVLTPHSTIPFLNTQTHTQTGTVLHLKLVNVCVCVHVLTISYKVQIVANRYEDQLKTYNLGESMKRNIWNSKSDK